MSNPYEQFLVTGSPKQNSPLAAMSEVDPTNCGEAVAGIMNPIFRQRGSNFAFPMGGIGAGDVTSMAKEFGSPVMKRGDITADSLRQSGPGTVIWMGRQPGEPNYNYGTTHAEVVMPHPETGELGIVSFSAGKGFKFKTLNDNYIKSLAKNTVAANPMSGGDDLERRAGAVAAEVDPYAQFLPKAGAAQEVNPYEAMAQPQPQAKRASGGVAGASTTPSSSKIDVVKNWLQENSPETYDALEKAGKFVLPAEITPEQVMQGAPEAKFVNEPVDVKGGVKAAMPFVRPVAEGLGTAGGAVLGTAGATPGVGTVAGAGLGYAIAKKGMDALESYATDKPAPGPAESLGESVKDIGTGAMMEMGGQVGGKVLAKGLEYAGKGIRPVLGRMSGTGTGAVDEALKGSEDFVKALRGKITGEEVVENAQLALQTIRNNRATEYQSKLANVAKVNQELDLTPLRRKVVNLMKQYGAKAEIGPTGEMTFDTSRIAMGKKGRNDIEDMLETVRDWGSKPGDKTPLGLDTLKRQLDDFYSDSGQARAFVTSLRTSVKDLIVKNVPEYAEMTKGYADATKLIKDIESGLMMRKQGIQGRIVADQTLRRLVSAMKDNFELRRELVDELSSHSSEDIAGQVAGHAMNALLPRGLAGLASVTEGGLALLRFIHPRVWVFLGASSPRMQGEFLQAYGRALKETKGLSMPVAKVTSYLSQMKTEANKYPDEETLEKKKMDDLKRRLNKVG